MPIVLATQSASPDAAIPVGGLSGVLITAGVVLLSIWIVSSVHRKIRRRNEQARSPREQIDQLKSRGASRASVESYMADAEELTRRLAAHLDNKAARLERLIAEADQRLEQLDRLEGAAPPRARAAHATNHPPRQSEPRSADRSTDFTSAATRTLDPLTEKVYALADQGHSALSIARELDEQTGKIELILALRSV